MTWEMLLRHLGPVSRKSRNFTGHFRVSQFPLYLKNGDDLIRQTSQLIFYFCCLENMLKDRLSKTSGWQFLKWLFGSEKFRDFRERAPRYEKREGREGISV